MRINVRADIDVVIGDDVALRVPDVTDAIADAIAASRCAAWPCWVEHLSPALRSYVMGVSITVQPFPDPPDPVPVAVTDGEGGAF